MSALRRLGLALADARHAWDYGSRAEYEAARRRARRSEAELLVAAIVEENPRLDGHDLDDAIRMVTASLPEDWPSYGDWPERWGRRR